MIFDIVILLVVVLCGASGFYRGFSYTVFNVIGWIISVATAFIATPFVKNYITDNTEFYDNFIPDNPIAEITSNMIFTLVTFIALFLIIKLVMSLLIRLVTRGDRKSFIGAIDGVFGMLFGFVKAAIIICLIIGVIIPVTEIFAPDFVTQVTKWMDGSYIAKSIYDNNPLFIMLGGFVA